MLFRSLSSIDRANRAIEEANKLSRFQSQGDVVTVQKSMSTRNVVLQHKDGKREKVDIQKYFATRDNKWNPYLREGDVVIVPTKNPVKDVFAIYGEVNSPGRYEFAAGDSLSDAVDIANGLTRLAMAEKVLFSRLNNNGTELTDRTINIGDIMSGQEPDIALEPGDRIIVSRKIDLREDYNTDIKGEVLYPGTYPITKNRTRLSEVIMQAGGFTDYASLTSATVFRKTFKTEELPDEQQIGRAHV